MIVASSGARRSSGPVTGEALRFPARLPRGTVNPSRGSHGPARIARSLPRAAAPPDGGDQRQVGGARLPSPTSDIADAVPVRRAHAAGILEFLAEESKRRPSYSLRMRTVATALIEESGRIAGVHADGPDGPLEVRASLVVGADGRQSALRDQAGLEVEELGAPMDVLWFRLSRSPDDPSQAMGRFEQGRILILLDRGEHWQAGYVIPKGARSRSGARASMDSGDHRLLAPFTRERLEEIRELGRK